MVYRVHAREPGLRGAVRAFVRRTYREVRAVDGVSFRIQPGELVGFLGPNGAGKTTTLKCLTGLLHPTAGRVEVLGHVPSRREASLQRQFSLVMGQKSQLWWDLPAADSLLLFKDIYRIDDVTYRARLAELVELLDLGQLLHTPVRKLSLGERMKCELAGSLLHQPRVLFLDEPTIGLDVVAQKRLREFILEYNRRHGATILLTSHYMDDVKELCSRVIVINGGRLVYDGLLQELVNRHATYKLILASFSKPVAVEQLSAIAEVLSFEPLRATLSVPRADVPARAARLLAELPVADLSVQEPELEDVIRALFQQ
jgi:ABC-2 type transport system ATP-binding protein